MRLSIGYQSLIALIAAIFVGLFFGPYTAILQPFGQLYIMFLLMVILPFIATGLIYGLGSLTPNLAKRLAKPAFTIIILTTLFVILVINLFGMLLPKVETSLFIVTNPAPEKTLMGLFDILIPQNPFYDLVNNYVPAIAIFGLLLGITLIYIKEKATFLSALNTTNLLILRFIRGLGRFSPLGIFCLLGSTLGTIDFQEFKHLIFYLVVFLIGILLTGFFVLPCLLSAIVGVPYKLAFKRISPMLILVFATTLPSLALPFLVTYIEELVHLLMGKPLNGDEPQLEGESLKIPEAIASLAYNFMQLGNLFLILFIGFATYYYRSPIDANKEILTNILAIPVGWGGASAVNSINFFAQILGLPKESIELFFASNSLTRNFQALISVISMYFFCTITTYSYFGRLRIRWIRLGATVSFVVVGLLAVVFGIKSAGWEKSIPDTYVDHFKGITIADLVPDPLPANFIKAIATNKQGSLKSIIETGVLRVGYNPNSVPYCFLNDSGELVGYDVAFANQLAKDLNCEKIEFVPFLFDDLDKELLNGSIDIGMSAVVMTSERLMEVAFTNAYADLENVLIIPAENRAAYEELGVLEKRSDLVIGGLYDYEKMAKKIFPLAQTVIVDTPDALMQGKIDAFYWSLTQATAWVYTHPDFVVISFPGKLGKVYFSYAIPPSADMLLRFVNDWLFLQKQTGFTKRQENFWILGKPINPQVRTWSILHDELQWAR